MALNGTPWHFERLAVNVDGIGEVIVTSRWTGTLRSVASRPPIGKATRAVPSAVSTKAPRRSNWRLRKRSTSLTAQSEEGADEITVTFNYAPIEGDSKSLTLFLRLNKGSGTEQKEEESMFTLEFEHTDVAQVDGNPIRPLEQAA